MSETDILFRERQYLGFNKYSILRRMVLAIFCFVAYFYSENREKDANLLFWLGIAILVLSVVSMFIMHLHTQIYSTHIILDGIWTTRKVKIELNNIVGAEKIPYSTYRLNNPVYNLHIKGTIRFYTSGKDAILLTDRDGLQYLIGTHKQEEFFRIISGLIGPNEAKTN